MNRDSNKKATIITAITRVCDTRHFAFRVDRLPDEFLEFMEWHAVHHPNNRFLKECNGFADFTYNYYSKLNKRRVSDISTNLIAVGFQKILDFYGKKVIRRSHYGIRNSVNTRRMQNAVNLCPDLMEDIVRVNSAGLWELKMHSRYGYYIEQHTTQLPSPMEVITHNQWISHNIGMVTKLNSMYQGGA